VGLLDSAAVGCYTLAPLAEDNASLLAERMVTAAREKGQDCENSVPADKAVLLDSAAAEGYKRMLPLAEDNVRLLAAGTEDNVRLLAAGTEVRERRQDCGNWVGSEEPVRLVLSFAASSAGLEVSTW
jgi:hypothetical protein